MDGRYQNWIQNKLASEDPLNKCREWTEEMLKEFPELKRVAGEVILGNGLDRHHWWLTTTKGEIIDPTVSQYNTAYYGFTSIRCYTEIPEDERPTGRCCNCGEYCYGGRDYLCSEHCERLYHAYIMSEMRR